MARAIAALPKTDLHVHLDGSLRLATLLELAREQGVALPADNEAGLRTAMRLGQPQGSLETYLKGFATTLSVLQEPQALARVMRELVEDAAAENVRVLEVRYSPMLHTEHGMRLTDVVETVLNAAHEAECATNTLTRLILCGIRNISPAHSLEMAELVVAYKNRGVVGFDLAGAELNHPAKDHQAAFALVRKNNVNVTIHAGEAFGPASIAQALHDCGAHRVGHACSLREDGELLHYVVDHRIPLECCVSSNLQTGVVATLREHPIRFYTNVGARVTVNTDNRLITDTSVTRELQLLHDGLGFTLDELKHVVRNGFKAAFLPYHEKKALLREVETELASIHA